MNVIYKLQFGGLKASPGGSCRRRKAVTDEGKTGTDFIDIFHIPLLG